MSNLPYNTAIPGAPQYAQADLTAKQAYQNALTRLNQQRQNTLQQYGYQGSVDPTSGTISNLGVNPNAPYGLYQQMLHTGAQQSIQARDDAMGRGLVGGLAHQAEDAGRYAFGQQSAQLGTNLTDALFNYQDQQDQAKYQYDQALYAAQQQAAQSAIDNGNFDPGYYDPSTYSDPYGYGDGSGDAGAGAGPAGGSRANTLAQKVAARISGGREAPRLGATRVGQKVSGKPNFSFTPAKGSSIPKTSAAKKPAAKPGIGRRK